MPGYWQRKCKKVYFNLIVVLNLFQHFSGLENLGNRHGYVSLFLLLAKVDLLS